MTVADEQLALMGRQIDRLVTVEARISPTSRNVIVPLYEAACAAQGGGPLSMLAGWQILENLGPGKVVFLTTGAGDPRWLPAGETDGPPGVAALALAIHAATGTPTPGDRARAECLFDEAARRGIPSLGTGDNGNELGFGLIADAVAKYKPNGARLCTRVKTDVLIPANTSNWGAYAVEAALAALTGRSGIMHSAELEQRMIEACVATHGADGSTGRHVHQVDSMPADVSCAVVTILGCIVRNGLITGFKRAF